MGGQSSGSLRFEDSNTILSFDGDIVLDGGGFSSVRKQRFDAIDLTSFAGIVVELETTEAYNANDSQPPLGLHLQFHDTSSYFGYASAFAIPLTRSAGETTSVYLPLSSFDRGTRIGYQCNDCQIDFSSVNEMDLYVLFQEGEFEVRVKSITAVDTPMRVPMPTILIASENDVKDLIEVTIQSGGKLYDYGYTELCNSVYRSMLNTFLAAQYNDDFVKSKTINGMICQGLQRAETQGKTDTAWTLRYTMDAILEEMGFLDVAQGAGWRPDATMAYSTVQCSGVTSDSSPTVSTNVSIENSTASPPESTMLSEEEFEDTTDSLAETNAMTESSAAPLYCHNLVIFVAGCFVSLFAMIL